MRAVLMTMVLALQAALAAAQVPDVATDIPPVHGLAARVMAGLGTPDLVIRPGASPHGYALRPSEAAALQRADIVFFVSSELTPWLERAMDPLAEDAMRVELQSIPGVISYGFRHRAVFDASPDGHDSGESEDLAEDHDDGHDHDGRDPHGWLDPHNGKLWLGAMAERLAALDPDNADTYRRNATEGIAEIDAAVATAETLLAPVREARFVVFHDAYQYFERRFGLHSVGAISLSDASKPGPRRIAEIRAAVAAAQVVCVFTEPQFNSGLVHTVFEASETRMAMLDPLGIGLPQGAGLYPALIEALAAEMAACLGAD